MLIRQNQDKDQISGYAQNSSIIHLKGLADKYGTPLYIIKKEEIEKNAISIQDQFIEAGLNVKVFFSYKSNPVPSVLSVLKNAGVGAEVVSEYEFWLAESIGVKYEDMIVNGAYKSDDLLSKAIISGVGLINIESLEELNRAKYFANEHGKTANIGFRINPNLKSSIYNFTTATGSAQSCFGFLKDSAEFEESVKIASADKFLNFCGLHFHLGTGMKKIHPYISALKTLFKAWDMLTTYGLNPKILDIGGGFNISSLKILNAYDYFSLTMLKASFKPKLPKMNLIEEVSLYLSESLKEYCREHNSPIPIIYLEPGRALTSSSQILILKVTRLSHRGKLNYAFCDGGAMSISMLLASEYHYINVLKTNNSTKDIKYNIIGNMPSPHDIVAINRKLPELRTGDYIVVMDVGAYFVALGNNFAGPRPAIVMTENEGIRLIRRRETFDDMLITDVDYQHHHI